MNSAYETPQKMQSADKVQFSPHNEFQIELRRRVDEFLKRTGRRQRDCPMMYLKSALYLTSFAVTYALLVFVVQTVWLAVPLAILLGFLTCGIGLNVQHDGGHQAFSKHPWINKLSSMSLDMIGGSSYFWHWKHGVFHHTYVNIAGHDSDIDLGILGRLSPHQKRYAIHSWQHLYLWPLYGFMVMRWHFFNDYRDAITGTLGSGGPRCPRPKGWDLVVFLVGKMAFVTLSLILPVLFHPVLTVVLYYLLTASVMGISMSIVFLLAHCVEEADFPEPATTTGNIKSAWAIHQVETTVDFSRGNPIACWLMGGLNFQVEHHLLPKICHVNYPAITKLVEETCREYGIKFRAHKSFWSGLASHYRWLRKMGCPTTSVN